MALMNFPLVTKVGENKPIRLNKSKIRKPRRLYNQASVGLPINQLSRNSDVGNRSYNPKCTHFKGWLLNLIEHINKCTYVDKPIKKDSNTHGRRKYEIIPVIYKPRDSRHECKFTYTHKIDLRNLPKYLTTICWLYQSAQLPLPYITQC